MPRWRFGPALRWLDARPLVCAILTLEVLGFLAYAHAQSFIQSPGLLELQVGVDFRQYSGATAGWLAGEPFYRPWQLVGPYDVLAPQVGSAISSLPVLYPPTVLPLFVPFALLPFPLAELLWWGVPLAVIAAVVIWHRPRPAAWPLLVYLALDKPSFWLVASGNPIMWAVAATALGTVFRWPAVFAILKPTLAPIALFGVRDRRWWMAAAGLAAVSLAFLPMWPDYITATLNARTSNAQYLVSNLYLAVFPLVVWVARRR